MCVHCGVALFSSFFSSGLLLVLLLRFDLLDVSITLALLLAFLVIIVILLLRRLFLLLLVVVSIVFIFVLLTIIVIPLLFLQFHLIVTNPVSAKAVSRNLWCIR